MMRKREMFKKSPFFRLKCFNCAQICVRVWSNKDKLNNSGESRLRRQMIIIEIVNLFMISYRLQPTTSYSSRISNAKLNLFCASL